MQRRGPPTGTGRSTVPPQCPPPVVTDMDGTGSNSPPNFLGRVRHLGFRWGNWCEPHDGRRSSEHGAHRPEGELAARPCARNLAGVGAS